jgi:acetyltransferase-like isoleucine patch superfamily enzyme
MADYENMLRGLRFNSRDITIRNIMQACQQTLLACRMTTPDLAQEKLRRIIGKLPVSAFIVTPVHMDYARNLFIGEDSFVNANCTFLDVGRIDIGNKVMIGPSCSFSAVEHFIHPDQRKIEPYMITPMPITVHDNVWINSGATILGGITIGENSTVAAGAVVTKDVPPNSLVAGCPAQVVKTYV